MAAIGLALLRGLEIPFYLGCGLIIAWLTWEQVELRWTLEHHGQRVEAEVVGHESRSGRTSITWRPVVRFATPDGRRVRATAEGAGDSSTSPWPRGSRVEVVYDPASPTRVMEAAELQRVGWMLALLPGLGAAMLILGLAMVRTTALLRSTRQ